MNLLHSGPRLLDTLPEFVSEYASKALVSRGVRVYVGQTYDREGDSFIGVMNKNVIQGDRVAWCVGAKPNTDFLRVKGSRFVDSQDYEDGEGSVDEDDDALHVPLDIIGRIRVDDGTRQVIGLDDVYAVGDCACKLPDQMLASYAHWEAEYVAKRLLCEGSENKLRRLGPYRLPPRLMAISLGPFDGVVLWGDRVVLRGWFAACLKALVQFWFIRFLPAPSPSQASPVACETAGESHPATSARQLASSDSSYAFIYLSLPRTRSTASLSSASRPAAARSIECEKNARGRRTVTLTHPPRATTTRFPGARAARRRPSSVVSRDDDDRVARMPVETTVETPTLDIPAETLWRARTTSLFMTCERAVFGDLDSAIVVYERDDADSNRCRYIVRARPNVRVPYVARMALGASSDGGGVTTYDEFIVDETQCTAPHLYEATVRSYSTFLNPHNSRVVGTVRCASVDGETRCALRLRLERASRDGGGRRHRARHRAKRARKVCAVSESGGDVQGEAREDRGETTREERERGQNAPR